MSAPLRKLMGTIILVISAWAGTALLWAWASGTRVQFFPGDFAPILLGAVILGTVLRYAMDKTAASNDG